MNNTDTLLNVILHLDTLSDIKATCQANKTYFNVCKNNIDYIFKSLVDKYDLRNNFRFLLINPKASDYTILKIYISRILLSKTDKLFL